MLRCCCCCFVLIYVSRVCRATVTLSLNIVGLATITPSTSLVAMLVNTQDSFNLTLSSAPSSSATLSVSIPAADNSLATLLSTSTINFQNSARQTIKIQATGQAGGPFALTFSPLQSTDPRFAGVLVPTVNVEVFLFLCSHVRWFMADCCCVCVCRLSSHRLCWSALRRCSSRRPTTAPSSWWLSRLPRKR